MDPQTITAIATAPGRGGVGIVRVSGPRTLDIANKILRFCPTPRHSHFSNFHGTTGNIIDQGIAIYFPAPHSFTGEDVLELQGHGGPVILDMLVSEITILGARPANPGEFTERAFLNDKLDLAQAEAVADLINANSQVAAKQAINSLNGEFSKKIELLVHLLIQLRSYVESSIDFPEEEIDFLSDGKVLEQLTALLEKIEGTLSQAKQGAIISEGMKVVIAGRPNAGKSSLLNALAEKDLAIVTNVPGTTRDLLKQQIHIDGMPLHFVDTAGLRESSDLVEQLGIKKAWQEINNCDQILLIIDSTDLQQRHVKEHWPEFFTSPKYQNKLTLVYNKIDKSHYSVPDAAGNIYQIAISAKEGNGLDKLKQHLKECMGFKGCTEGGFSARRRHIHALESAKSFLLKGKKQLEINAAGELLAEELRLAQNKLSEITGVFTPDDLLGEIFSSFCIGK